MTFYIVSALIIGLGCAVIITDEHRRQRRQARTGATLFAALVAYVADGGDVDDVVGFREIPHPSGRRIAIITHDDVRALVDA